LQTKGKNKTTQNQKEKSKNSAKRARLKLRRRGDGVVFKEGGEGRKFLGGKNVQSGGEDSGDRFGDGPPPQHKTYLKILLD